MYHISCYNHNQSRIDRFAIAARKQNIESNPLVFLLRKLGLIVWFYIQSLEDA
jgi:hypothetical protein